MLANGQTRECLTIAGGVVYDNNVDAAQAPCDADPVRRWWLEETSVPDVYKIKNAATGRCLTIAGGVSPLTTSARCNTNATTIRRGPGRSSTPAATSTRSETGRPASACRYQTATVQRTLSAPARRFNTSATVNYHAVGRYTEIVEPIAQASCHAVAGRRSRRALLLVGKTNRTLEKRVVESKYPGFCGDTA